MKNPVKSFKGVSRPVWLAVLPFFLQLAPASTHGATFNLTDENSSVVVNTSTDQGMNNWTVDGQQQLFVQWFWYRAGSIGGEAPINTLPIVSESQTSASTLNVKYSNGQFSIETTYSLLGGSAGSGSSDMGEQVKIKNLTSAPLDFHFFQYTDFDLGGAGAGDSVQLGQNLQGLFNEALQIKDNVRFSDTVVTPGANHGEAGVFPATLIKLNDGSPTTLTDAAGPVVGDATWAFQWDKVIAAGGTLIISIDKNIYVAPVPEPTALSLVPLGLLLMGLAKRGGFSRKK